jgi:release factor glutamine methyltransferase
MSHNFQTIKDIRIYIINELKDIYPEIEITAITNHIFKTQFGIDRLHLLINPDQSSTSVMTDRILEICAQLKTGKPIQYILGETIFFDCILKVNIDTLIPRPETEELVSIILKENKEFKGGIIDFGTGSGCIAIALKKNMPLAIVTAVEISEPALESAKNNALLNNVKISFIKEDIFQFDPLMISKTDIIVSNPPYVLESEKKFMNPNVLDFEPHKALFVPDEDPLIFYRAILSLAQKMLTPGGRIYFEINETKGIETCNLLYSAGFKEISILDDLSGKNRFVKGKFYG